MCFRRKKKGNSKVLPGGSCLRDSEAEQRALQLVHKYCSNVDGYSSAPESNKQNPSNKTLDLPFFFRYKGQSKVYFIRWPVQNVTGQLLLLSLSQVGQHLFETNINGAVGLFKNKSNGAEAFYELKMKFDNVKCSILSAKL